MSLLGGRPRLLRSGSALSYGSSGSSSTSSIASTSSLHLEPPPAYTDPPALRLLLSAPAPPCLSSEDRASTYSANGTEWLRAAESAKMELSITSHANDVYLYPIDPKLPESAQETLRNERGGAALYVASVHLKVPSNTKPKDLKGGIQKLEVKLEGRESLSFAGGAHLEQNFPFSVTKVLEGDEVSNPTSSLVRASSTSSDSKKKRSSKRSGSNSRAGSTSRGGSSPSSTPPSSAGPSSPRFGRAQLAGSPLPLPSALPLQSPPADDLSPAAQSPSPFQDLELEPGRVYSWDFIFEIPHDSAPYERSKHGRLYQRISAKLTLKGGGIMGSGKKTFTAEKNVFFVALPGNDESLAYSFTHRDAAEHLGPLLITTRSQHLTVGGYIRTALSLPSPSADLQILEAKLQLIQTFTLHSRKQPLVQPCPNEDTFDIFVSDGSDITREEDASSGSEGGDEDDGASARSRHVSYEGSWINKLPKDNQLRSSALPGSDSAIKPRHQFEFSLKYTYPGMMEELGKPFKVYTATWSVQVPSCAARYENLRLPGYTAYDTTPVPELMRDEWDGPNEHESHTHCACGDSLERLVRVEADAEREQQHRLAEDIRQDIEIMRLTSRSSSRSASRAPSRSASRNVSRRASLSLDRAVSGGNRSVSSNNLAQLLWQQSLQPQSPNSPRANSPSVASGTSSAVPPSYPSANGPGSSVSSVRFADAERGPPSRGRSLGPSAGVHGQASAHDGRSTAASPDAELVSDGGFSGVSTAVSSSYFRDAHGLGSGDMQMDAETRRKWKEKERQLYEVLPPEA